MPTPLETYQDKAKQKARDNIRYGFNEKCELETNQDHITAQTITDLLDEIEEVMGEEVRTGQEDEVWGRLSEDLADGYNTLHRKLTKKINQLRA